MATVRLIHWNDAEAAPRVKALRDAGHAVLFERPEGMPSLRPWAASPPDAFVIDLTRMPSHGRVLGCALRQSKGTRRVPLVFVGGAEEKVERVRALLPDATYASWARIRSALRAALAHPPERPVVPKAGSPGGPSSVPLAARLGLKAGVTLVALESPGSFVDALGELPDGVTVRERGRGDMVVWFVRSAEDLEADVERVTRDAGDAPLWIAWPRRTSELAGDLGQSDVIAVGQAMGLAACKVCSIDACWSAMQFRPPKAPKASRR